MQPAVVVTADIVHFTRLALKKQKELVAGIAVVFGTARFEFYRGDSFQAYLKQPAPALRAVLQARALARSFGVEQDVRASIGIGPVDSPVRSLRTATGAAFVLSGRSFDEMTGADRLRIVTESETEQSALRILAYYCDSLFRRLTAKQAAVIFELLAGSTQVEAAKKRKIAQATANKHAQAGGWSEMDRLLREYEKLVTPQTT
ncbi:MAG: hypothetical protein JWP27_61 [Flaviaesturariibacter sp.]|nr:hypothetical protein [Flaviaesturariibacter sp.]